MKIGLAEDERLRRRIQRILQNGRSGARVPNDEQAGVGQARGQLSIGADRVHVLSNQQTVEIKPSGVKPGIASL
jgi:hypothetical protein